MELAARKSIYKEIECYRSRPLIIYATSTRQGVRSLMAGDAVREFIDQIDAILEGDSVDVLLHSTGGDALTAWKLMSLLRERFKTVGVLVPLAAFSAATIFALGADEIVMHPHASLGPIDPQIGIHQPNGQVRQFAYEDVGAFLRFLGEEAKITEMSHQSPIIEKLFSIVDPIHVGGAKRASELSSSVGERLLSFHMKDKDQEAEVKQIAENLNKSFFAHGDAVSRSRAQTLKLKIAASDPILEKLIWTAYEALESYMEIRKPFNHLQHFLNDNLNDNAAAGSLKLGAPVRVPTNAPPQVAQQLWNAAANQALQSATEPAPSVPYRLVNAVIESTRIASEFLTLGTVEASRGPNREIQMSTMDYKSGWQSA